MKKYIAVIWLLTPPIVLSSLLVPPQEKPPLRSSSQWIESEKELPQEDPLPEDGGSEPETYQPMTILPD